MAAKKASSSSQKQLKAAVKKLEAKLARADAKAARWKKTAKEHEASAASSKKRISALETKLAKAQRVKGQPDISRGVQVPEAVPAESAAPTVGSSSTPDASWTVVELRAEARSRGLTGLSGKSKAEIIAALS